MALFYPSDVIETLAELGISPEEGEQQGILSAHEARMCRLVLDERALNDKLQAYYGEYAERERVARAAWEAKERQELPLALAAYDAAVAEMPRRISGSYRMEYDNWLDRRRVHEDALKAAQRAGPLTMEQVRRLRPFEGRPPSGDDGDCGPGGDFMRAGLD